MKRTKETRWGDEERNEKERCGQRERTSKKGLRKRTSTKYFHLLGKGRVSVLSSFSFLQECSFFVFVLLVLSSLYYYFCFSLLLIFILMLHLSFPFVFKIHLTFILGGKTSIFQGSLTTGTKHYPSLSTPSIFPFCSLFSSCSSICFLCPPHLALCLPISLFFRKKTAIHPLPHFIAA